MTKIEALEYALTLVRNYNDRMFIQFQINVEKRKVKKYVIWGCKESEHLPFPVTECDSKLEAIGIVYDLNKFSEKSEMYWWEVKHD